MIEVIEREGAGPVFALRGDGFTLVLHVTPEGLLGQSYLGPPVRDPMDTLAQAPRTHRDGVAMHPGTEDLPLTAFAQAYPVAGASDFRHCALDAETAGGVRVSTLLCRGHRIEDGKPGLAGLPSSRGKGARTLTIEMADAQAGLAAELRYAVWPDQGALAASVRLRNEGGEAIILRRALSVCLGLPPGPYDALHLHGSWASEFQVARAPLAPAQLVIESVRGAPGAAQHPFLALLSPGATEEAGCVTAVTLAYSGNHRHTAERGEFGDARLSAGISPEGWSWQLDPGEAFETPEAVVAQTDEGLGGMSRAFHRFVREEVSPPAWRGVARPSYLNTWEAAYFDVDEAKVEALAGRAASLGLDMLVLDDGWFEGRTSDRGGLGTWRADPDRFPSGIEALAGRVRARGLHFGLWLEPEMVSPDSPLLAEHPDWVLGVPGGTPSLGRHQLTLDLCCPEVRQHVYEAVARHLRGGAVSYVKWDMNRPMTEAGSRAVPMDRQREVPHRYVLGLYEVMDRLTTAFPDVLFEACASGGARLDLGMLTYCAQAWPSDMVDPGGRAAVLSGASLLYPMDVLAAYAGPSPNHQNGRASSLAARLRAGALCAAQGVSLNEADLDAHADELRDWFSGLAARGDARLGARFDRLATGPSETVWQLTSADGTHVEVVDIRRDARPNVPDRTARLRGLDPGARYQVAGGGAFGGDALMGAGLPLARADAGDIMVSHWVLTRAPQ